MPRMALWIQVDGPAAKRWEGEGPPRPLTRLIAARQEDAGPRIPHVAVADGANDSERPGGGAMEFSKRAMIGIAVAAIAWAPAQAGEAAMQGPEQVSVAAARAAFDRLKALAGAWRGRRPDGREIGVSYRLSAAGTVLVETWALGPQRESLTLYHMDGEALIATHYCPIGNQPRLRLTRTNGDRLDFAFRDATNLAPGEAHQHDFWIAIDGPAAITRSETYVQGAESESETIAFVRVAGG